MKTDVIYNEDCIEGMKKLPDNSIDLIATDPPYNIGKAEWDKIDNYIEWCGKWISQCQRVLKDNGSFYFWHNDFEVMAELQSLIKNKTDFVFKSMITWEKYQTNKQYYGRNVLMGVNNKGKRNYFSMSEYCLFYTFQNEKCLNIAPIKEYLKKEKEKSGLTNKEFNLLFSKYFNKQGCKDRSVIEHYWQNSQWVFPTKEIYENILQSTGYFNKPYDYLEKEYQELRYTFNFIKKDITRTWLYKPAEKIGHITPKPLSIIENIIKHSSNENDIVLDCFGGSGTTAVACQNLNRRYILIEKEKEYCELTKSRLKNYQPALF